MLKGVYVLIIQVAEDTSIIVGALGKLTLKQGLYAYVGSGQNNLKKRIQRHLRKKKSLFWHVDYLLNNSAARIVRVLYKEATKDEECAIARLLSERGKAIEGFGCSDCMCRSHLFHISDYHFLQNLQFCVYEVF